MNTLKKNRSMSLLSKADLDDKNIKVRVNTYIDLDVVKILKAEAKKQKIGYQTLLNQMLRMAAFKQFNLEDRIVRIEKQLKII